MSKINKILNELNLEYLNKLNQYTNSRATFKHKEVLLGEVNGLLQAMEIIKKHNKIVGRDLVYEIREINILNRKELESVLRNNASDLLESEEIITARLSEGYNLGIYVNNTLVGYLLGSYDIINNLLRNENVKNAYMDLNKENKSAYIITDILITPEYRNFGMATTLIINTLNTCNSDFNLIMGRNESNGRKWQLESTANTLGYRKLIRESDFWQHVSIVEDFMCKSCNKSCECELDLRYIQSAKFSDFEYKEKLITQV